MTVIDLLSKLIDQIPLLFFIGLTIWWINSDDEDDPTEEAVGKLYAQHGAERERVSATLELIAAIVRKRPR